MGPLQQANLYHTGLVVEDIEAAARALSAAFGYRWTKPAAGNDRPVVYADGTRATVRLKFCYSLDAPHLELIESVPGTPWAHRGQSLHHLGYWVENLANASAALSAGGFPLVVWAEDEHGRAPARFAHHEGPDGSFIELVDRTIFGMPFQEWLATSERFDADHN